MNKKNYHQGFTLIEVMIALSVVAIGLMATLKAINEEINSAMITRNKMMALWVLENKISEIRINPLPPEISVNQGKEILMNQTWYWQTNTAATANIKIRKIDISISLSTIKDPKDSIIKQSIYLSDLR